MWITVVQASLPRQPQRVLGICQQVHQLQALLVMLLAHFHSGSVFLSASDIAYMLYKQELQILSMQVWSCFKHTGHEQLTKGSACEAQTMPSFQHQDCVLADLLFCRWHRTISSCHSCRENFGLPGSSRWTPASSSKFNVICKGLWLLRVANQSELQPLLAPVNPKPYKEDPNPEFGIYKPWWEVTCVFFWLFSSGSPLWIPMTSRLLLQCTFLAPPGW